MGPAAAAQPLVSVVVPTFNCAATIGALLDSLAAQTFRDFELIVSDGGSNDTTVEQVRQASPALPDLRIDSRPDSGVYDAINKGVQLARGQWIIVLGGDDRVHAHETLNDAARMLRQSSADMVYGDVLMMARIGDVQAGSRYAGAFTLDELLTKNICQQAIFYRRTLFESFGLFDLRYRVWADWDFNLRVAFRRPIEWMDLVVADYAATGMSTKGGDPLFEADAADRLCDELLAHPARRELWPLQRRLLRQTDIERRRGQWLRAARLLGTYLFLQWKRLAGASPP